MFMELISARLEYIREIFENCNTAQVLTVFPLTKFIATQRERNEDKWRRKQGNIWYGQQHC